MHGTLGLLCAGSAAGYLTIGGLICVAFSLKFLYDYGLVENDKTKRLKLCCCNSREGNLASGWCLWAIAFVLYVADAWIFTRVMTKLWYCLRWFPYSCRFSRYWHLL